MGSPPPRPRRCLSMNVDRSSLCNSVVNFLLEEKYLLTAFELLHELIEDGRHDHAVRLRDFFNDPNQFPPDQISRLNNLALKGVDPQSLLEEKVTVEEKLSISEYELRLAQEDLSRLKIELQKQKDPPFKSPNGAYTDVNATDGPTSQPEKRASSLSDLGQLKDAEQKDINCAVKEYLLSAGYRLTAMTFIEEVSDQNLDAWPKSSACVSDALRRYYCQYLSSTTEAAEERISITRENESLVKQNERLNNEKDLLLRSKEFADGQIVVLTKSLESAQKDLKDREARVQKLNQSLELQRKELNDCRAEITSLKMHIEGARASRGWNAEESENVPTLHTDNNHKVETKALHTETENMKDLTSISENPESILSLIDDEQPTEKVVEMNEVVLSNSFDSLAGSCVRNTENLEQERMQSNEIAPKQLSDSHNGNINGDGKENAHDQIFEPPPENTVSVHKSESPKREATSEKMALETIQIVSDALPKIVPYVLINHREELLPLIMCAIEHHPDGSVRDSLTHTLFNLIKRPDEQQRRIIMDASVSLAKNVGDMRTETELLPQCWEQINHIYEERRLLVAQSCGELAEFVRPEIRDSLILSIVQQLVEDAATVVRVAAAHNLALLLPLFPNVDKYFKVEELMFQLVCDPSGLVVETTLKELVPAVISWGGKLDHILRHLLCHILGSAQRCPPLSGVEGSVDSHLRVLGERERWNIDVLLRMLMELLPFVHRKAIETCPLDLNTEMLTTAKQEKSFFSASFLKLYAGGNTEWPAFDWMYIDCFPDLIHLSCLLPQKEDNLRTRIVKFLLAVSECFGDDYIEHVMLPVFLVAVGDGDSADLTVFPYAIHSRIKGLRPISVMAERLAVMCVLPLLLSGILGARTSHEKLSEYLRKLLVQNRMGESSWSANHTAEVIDAVRFLCTFEVHHGSIVNILWELVVSSNENLKTDAANLLKVLVPYIDIKVASTHVLPALVTLGSDQNLNVKNASIDAFGVVAQHFKNETIVEKIRIQMDAFLEDGSHEATVSVIHALTMAVPQTTERLREYLLSKIFQLTAMPLHRSDIMRRRERANAFCEAVRALDATDLPASSIRDYLFPAIQNLLKDSDALDPVNKEALEIILKERSGGTLGSIGKVTGSHLGIASSVTSFFGESPLLLGKKETEESSSSSVEANIASPPPQPTPQAQQDDNTFRRIMRGGFGEMLRGKGKGADESPPNNIGT